MSITKQEIKNLINNSAPVIFEIGCADGIDTLEFINTFNESSFKLFCFEPDPRNIEEFKKRVSDSRVFLHEIAIGDKDGLTTFNQSSTIYSSSLKNPNIENIQKTWPMINFENSFDVIVTTIDSFIKDNSIEIVDFIWADVQGAEDLMISGGKNSLIDKVRYMYTEYSNVEYYENEPSLNKIIELMGDNWEVVQVFAADVLLKNKNL
jgi:FkbM family methyltransferase